MSCQGREELHRLVDALPDEQIDKMLNEMRRHTQPRVVASDSAFAWIGGGVANNGRSDNATRMDELLTEGFGRN